MSINGACDIETANTQGSPFLQNFPIHVIPK